MDVSESTIHLTIEDYVAFNLHVNDQKAAKQIYYKSLGVLFVCGCFVANMFYFIDQKHAALVVLWLTIIFTFLRFFRGTRSNAQAVRSYITNLIESHQTLALLGPRQLRIDQRGVTSENEYFSEFVTWQGIESIETSDEYAFLIISGLSTIIVPKRDLGEVAFERFVSQCRTYKSESNAL